MSLSPLLTKAQAVARAAREAGGRALLVGGYVRDELLGRQPKDADLEVYGVAAEALPRLLRRFGRVDCVGESFRVYKLVWRQPASPGANPERYELDVSLPRQDRKVGHGHRGFEVQGDPCSTVEEAARRRDFTVNAIMRDPLTGELIDPFDGRGDLDRRLLRAVDERHFAEDSLRVLRAMQFAARFEMSIEADTLRLCRDVDLADLPRERVWGEWEKLLLQAERPSLGLRAARELLILEKLFPYLERALERRGAELLAAVDRAASGKSGLPYPKQITLMLGVLGVFLGWRGTRRLLDDFNIHTVQSYDVQRQVIVLVGERGRVRQWYRRRDTLPDRELRYLSARCDAELVYRLTRARGDVNAAQWFKSNMQRLGVWEGPPAPLLMGRHLLEMGLQPGPRVGEIVREIFLRQLGGEFNDAAEAHEAARLLMAEQTAVQIHA